MSDGRSGCTTGSLFSDNDVLQGGVFQDVGHGVTHFAEQGRKGSRSLEGGRLIEVFRSTSEGSQRTVHGPDDLGDGDLIGGAGQFESALSAAA